MKQQTWKVLFGIFFCIIADVSSSTHWIVTENGRVQSQLDSAFHLRRPYDLLALLEQEKRVDIINDLYEELAERKAAIDSQWSSLEGATDLEARLFAQDSNCLRAGGPLSDTDLYPSLVGDVHERIRLDDYIDEDVSASDSPLVPLCTQATPLDFSMHVFEHLHAMVARKNLSFTPELTLVAPILGQKDIVQFGTSVALGLQKNATSWLHHNLAAIYWRIHGDAPKAIECARRAVHFAPRQYRDLALLNLGAIFYHARYPAEAAIILHAAVDHAPLMATNHFLLGNVYAILGDYNRSLACYDNAVKLRPSLDQVVRIKHSVLCHRKLEKGLLELHDSLQDILSELHDYRSQQQQFLKHQEKLIWEQAPLEVRLLGHDHGSLAMMLSSKGQNCLHRIHNGRPVLSCDVSGENKMFAHSQQIDVALSFQVLLKNVESQAKKISEQMFRHHLAWESANSLGGDKLPDLEFTETDQYNAQISQDAEVDDDIYADGKNFEQEGDDKESEYVNAETYPRAADPSIQTAQISNYKAMGHTQEKVDWPKEKDCLVLSSSENFPLIFLPPEHKGFE